MTNDKKIKNEDIQKSFSEVLKEVNQRLDKEFIEKDLKKSYMKLLSK